MKQIAKPRLRLWICKPSTQSARDSARCECVSNLVWELNVKPNTQKNGPEDSTLLAEHKINACANSFRVGLCTKTLETLLGDGHFHNPRARATGASSEGAVMHMSKSFFPNARRSSIGCSSSNSRPSSFKFGSSMNFNVLQSGLPER